MLRLNIIGCGNVGKSLGRLWTETNVFEIGDILTQSLESATAAKQWIGSGHPISSMNSMQPADVFLITTSDDTLADAAESLVKANILKTGNIVLHCSGALSSEVLQLTQQSGAYTASIHPVKSFATPCESLSDFQGTFCGCEGDKKALEVLEPAFEKIGATTFQVDPQQKPLYHAASVLSCNYLTSLIEVSTQAYEKAGIPREIAQKIMQPIVQGTVDNIFEHGTTKALTGPIARGDTKTVSNQLNAMENWNPAYAEIYKSLGLVACSLSEKQGNASAAQLNEMRGSLSSKQ